MWRRTASMLLDHFIDLTMGKYYFFVRWFDINHLCFFRFEIRNSECMTAKLPVGTTWDSIAAVGSNTVIIFIVPYTYIENFLIMVSKVTFSIWCKQAMANFANVTIAKPIVATTDALGKLDCVCECEWIWIWMVSMFSIETCKLCWCLQCLAR